MVITRGMTDKRYHIYDFCSPFVITFVISKNWNLNQSLGHIDNNGITMQI